jgi:hypothetical protein
MRHQQCRKGMDHSTLFDRLWFWTQRVGTFLLLSFVDDPAWLALMFC